MSTATTFSAFTSARLGIYASMKGLQVTGNNISNINTRGYTRQVLDQVSLRTGGNDRYQSMYDVNIGSGALCVGVSQIRDPYLDIRFRNEQSAVGALDAKMSGLEDLKALFDEVGKGDGSGVLEAQFNDLVTQLQQLSTAVGDQTNDSLVRGSAEAIVNLLKTYAGKLEGIVKDTVKDFKQDIDTVNGLLSNIRDLNSEIRKSEIHGDGALELRDQRNNLIDELSYYMKIDVTTEQENMGGGQYIDRLVIKLAGNGQNNDTEKSTLIYGEYATQLSVEQVPVANPAYDPNGPDLNRYLDKDGKPTDVLEKAKMVDSSNYDLALDALKDAKDRVWSKSVPKTLGQWGPETDPTKLQSVKAEAEAAYNQYQAGTVTNANGDIVTKSYKLVEKSEMIEDLNNPGSQIERLTVSLVETTDTLSGGVTLKDNDLYGALQSTRELLTEAGEFTDATVIKGDGTSDPIDPRAATKYGIPYYQRSLDALAQKLAGIFNSANVGYMTNTDGNYVDADGNEVTVEVDTPAGKVKMPMRKGAPMWTDSMLEGLNIAKDTDGAWVTDANGNYLDKNGDPVEVPVAGMANPVKLNKNDQWTLEQVEDAGAQAYEKGGALFSVSSDSNDAEGITAKNISISKGWSTGAVQIVAQTEIGIPGISQSEKHDNIIHLLAELCSNKQDYRASDVTPGAYEGDTVYFSGTIQERLSYISSTLANESRVTSTLLDNYSAAATELNTSRDSVSSVDLNDEAANMMMYQKTYAAACRMMTTIDEVLDKLINGTGVVGR